VFTDVIVDRVSIGNNAVGRYVSDVAPDLLDDLFERSPQRFPCGSAASQKYLIGPDAHLHLTIGDGIDCVTLGYNRIRNEITELVGMSG
jgi:hypothetical protein